MFELQQGPRGLPHAWCATSPRPRSRRTSPQLGPRAPLPGRPRPEDGRPRAVRPGRAGGVRRRRAATSPRLCVAIEELGRVDQSIGHHPVGRGRPRHQPDPHATAPRSRRQRWLPDLVAGRALAAFGLTEPEAGSDAGATRTRRRLRRRRVGRQRRQGVHHQLRHRHHVRRHGHRAHRARTTDGSPRDQRDHGPRRHARASPSSRAYDKLGWHASDTHGLSFDDCRVPEDNLLGERGRRLPAVPQDPRRRPDRDHRARRRAAPRPASRPRTDYAKDPDRVRPADRRQPGRGLPDRRPRRRGRGRPAAHLQGGLAEGRAPRRPALGRRGQAGRGDRQAATPPRRP